MKTPYKVINVEVMKAKGWKFLLIDSEDEYKWIKVIDKDRTLHQSSGNLWYKEVELKFLRL